MEIQLKRTFYPDVFNFRIGNGNSFCATNRKGDLWKEGVDYDLNERDKPGLKIIQANGSVTIHPLN